MVQSHLLFRNKKGLFEDQFTIYFLTFSWADVLVLFSTMVLGGFLFRLVAGGSKFFDWTDFIIPLIPIIFGLALVIPKPNIAPLYIILLSILTMKKEKKKYKKIHKNTNKTKSTVLGFADNFVFSINTQTDTVDEIIREDLLKPIRLGFTLYTKDGNYLSEKTLKIYINDDLTDTIQTSLDGKINVSFIPETEGRKTIIMKTLDGKENSRRVIDIKEKSPF